MVQHTVLTTKGVFEKENNKKKVCSEPPSLHEQYIFLFELICLTVKIVLLCCLSSEVKTKNPKSNRFPSLKSKQEVQQ